jgi:ABC-type sugar transport system permease subunit
MSTLQRSRRSSAVLTAPGVLLYVGLVLAPIGLAAYYSLTDWNGVRPRFELVGLANYARALADPDVLRAFTITGVIAATATALLNLFAIPLAVLLARDDWFTRVQRSFVFYPLVLAPIVVGFIWQTFLNTNGLANEVITGLGGRKVPFLGDPTLGMVSVLIVTIWQSLSFTTILYLAALKTIPGDLYEAARIDGAGAGAQFRHLTVPLLAPAVTVNVVLLVVFFMRLYEYVVAMTGGGPAGATRTIAYLLVQQAFTANRYAYGSAIAILLLAVVSLVAVTLFVLLRRREYAR